MLYQIADKLREMDGLVKILALFGCVPAKRLPDAETAIDATTRDMAGGAAAAPG